MKLDVSTVRGTYFVALEFARQASNGMATSMLREWESTVDRFGYLTTQFDAVYNDAPITKVILNRVFKKQGQRKQVVLIADRKGQILSKLLQKSWWGCFFCCLQLCSALKSQFYAGG